MISKLQEILGSYGTVKKCQESETYFIKFSQKMSDLMCTASIDYPSYWKMKIKNAFPYKGIDYFHHHEQNSATIYIIRTIRDERREKLKKINNDNKE
jgi:hypothetical protein